MNQVGHKKLGTGKEYRTERKGMEGPDGRQKLFHKALKGEKNQI
jgi:hypothetical protein